MGFRITILSINMTNQSHRIVHLIPGPLKDYVTASLIIKWRYFCQSWNPYAPYCFSIVKSLWMLFKLKPILSLLGEKALTQKFVAKELSVKLRLLKLYPRNSLEKQGQDLSNRTKLKIIILISKKFGFLNLPLKCRSELKEVQD